MMSRAAAKKQPKRSTLVALWIPGSMLAALDDAVATEDTDRSKLIRRAIRNHLTRLGLDIPGEK